MAPTPAPQPPRAYGEATIRLHMQDDGTGYLLQISSSWFTPDGELREAGLSLSGADGELYDVLNETATWLYRRWRRPVTDALRPGPFD